MSHTEGWIVNITTLFSKFRPSIFFSRDDVFLVERKTYQTYKAELTKIFEA